MFVGQAEHRCNVCNGLQWPSYDSLDRRSVVFLLTGVSAHAGIAYCSLISQRILHFSGLLVKRVVLRSARRWTTIGWLLAFWGASSGVAPSRNILCNGMSSAQVSRKTYLVERALAEETSDRYMGSTRVVVYEHGRGMNLFTELHDEVITVQRWRGLWQPFRSRPTSPAATVGMKHVGYEDDINRSAVVLLHELSILVAEATHDMRTAEPDWKEA